MEIRILAAGDVAADYAAMAVRDRLLDDDRVQRLAERPVKAEDEPGLDRVLEEGAVEAANRRHDDVVEIAFASAVPLHRVVAELERGDVRLAIRAADDLVHRLLDRERARLDELGPVIEREKVFKGFLRLLAHRDQIDELPVILGRQADALVVRDAPHGRRIHGATEVHMELSQFISERVRHRRRLAEAEHNATRRMSGWHGGAGCARAAHRSRRWQASEMLTKRTGRRARDPDPGTGPAQPCVGLAALLARWRATHPSAAPWT